ncbi:MAG: AbrB/MazE/SpoVT family DNA-binding domain-containing protein [Candidatus Peribacteraceae bacterium]|nr:AbrB/MazE/SpoVT family DNA-binding domain-containing protein [Candidatus Peribacteraceae bacterium]
MTTKVLQSTERGQITLPKQWRDHFKTDNYLVEMHNDRLVIIPFQLGVASDEEVLFDADRDNDGKGVSPDEIIRALKKIRHGRN